MHVFLSYVLSDWRDAVLCTELVLRTGTGALSIQNNIIISGLVAQRRNSFGSNKYLRKPECTVVCIHSFTHLAHTHTHTHARTHTRTHARTHAWTHTHYYTTLLLLLLLLLPTTTTTLLLLLLTTPIIDMFFRPTPNSSRYYVMSERAVVSGWGWTHTDICTCCWTVKTWG